MKAPKILEADTDELLLDPKNPRLRRRPGEQLLDQSELLKAMVAWELDELIVSYIESGFWKHEPLLVVEEDIPECTGKVVIEGNRRLAALKCIRSGLRNQPIPSRRITKIVAEALTTSPNLHEDSGLFK